MRDVQLGAQPVNGLHDAVDDLGLAFVGAGHIGERVDAGWPSVCPIWSYLSGRAHRQALGGPGGTEWINPELEGTLVGHLASLPVLDE